MRVVVYDPAHPPGYDTAGPQAQAAFGRAHQASAAAYRVYSDAVQEAGGHRGREVRSLFAAYMATVDSLGESRAALSAPTGRDRPAALAAAAALAPAPSPPAQLGEPR